MKNKPELLSPAGNLENLKIAVVYGADAVYLGGKNYSLRAKADNFTIDEIEEGVKFAHEKGKKVYVTLNIIPHNKDFENLGGFVKQLEKTGIDGIIAADPGMISVVKEVSPAMPVHLSTQANNTNYKSAEFWHKLGIKRITLARELSFDEIKEMCEKAPAGLELETFVHGAVCVSYSGRCMLSAYMTGRDANKGECAHPCRYHYTLKEQKRPDEYFDVFEDDRGSYIFNSKDLCLIEHIPELIAAGVKSFKIEGRMKSSYYVALVTSVYRKAIDGYLNDTENYSPDKEAFKELGKVNHRKYSTGFFSSKPGPEEYIYDSTGYTHPYMYLGLITGYDEKTKLAAVRQQNKFSVGDEVEVIGPGGSCFKQKVEEMLDEENNTISSTPHPQQAVKIKMQFPVKQFDIIRMINKTRSTELGDEDINS